MDHLPPAKPRPRFALELFLANMDYQQAAAALQSSRETVRLICLPFDDPRRRVPNRRLMDRIVAWTDGRVRPADFYEAAPMDVAPACEELVGGPA